jgi:formate hydrogenlyase transcriptional activator
VSQSVTSHRDLTALFRDLVERLPRVVSFDSLWLVLHDPARDRMRLHVLEGPARAVAEETAWPLERPMEESPSALVWNTQEPLVVFNLADDPRYRAAFRLLLDNGVHSCCILPLTTAHRRLGAVGFGYARPHNYSDADVEFLGQVASQIAVAVDNVLAHEEAGELQAALAEERDRLRLLLDLHNTLAPNPAAGALAGRIYQRAMGDALRLHQRDPAGAGWRAAADLCAGCLGTARASGRRTVSAASGYAGRHRPQNRTGSIEDS